MRLRTEAVRVATAAVGDSVTSKPYGKSMGKGHRLSSVNDRTQNQAPNGNAIKRDATSGRIIDQKTMDGSCKGIAKEPDHRRS